MEFSRLNGFKVPQKGVVVGAEGFRQRSHIEILTLIEGFLQLVLFPPAEKIGMEAARLVAENVLSPRVLAKARDELQLG